MVSVKTRQLRVTSREPIPWTVDGEYGGRYTDAVIENLPRALCINAPWGQVKPKRK